MSQPTFQGLLPDKSMPAATRAEVEQIAAGAAVAAASALLQLVGPGRPDQPATTGGIIVGSEAVGTTYISTDGAGVGAWAWRKRPGATGWKVVDRRVSMTPAVGAAFAGTATLDVDGSTAVLTLALAPNLAGAQDMLTGLPAHLMPNHNSTIGQLRRLDGAALGTLLLLASIGVLRSYATVVSGGAGYANLTWTIP